MENSARSIAVEADSRHRLPGLNRLWLAFQAGVTRRMDLLSVSSHDGQAGPERFQRRELL